MEANTDLTLREASGRFVRTPAGKLPGKPPGEPRGPPRGLRARDPEIHVFTPDFPLKLLRARLRARLRAWLLARLVLHPNEGENQLK